MASRVVGRDLVSFELISAAQHSRTRNVSLTINLPEANTRTITQRHAARKTTSKSGTISAEFQIPSIPSCGINMTVFTHNAVDYLGDLVDWTATFTTATDEGRGIADLWSFPNALSTDMTISGTLLIDEGSEALFFQLYDGTIANLSATMVFTGDGYSITAPVRFTQLAYNFTSDGLVQVTFQGGLNGTPTVTGDGILTSIATGTAVGTWEIDDGETTYDGNALLTSATITGNREAITTISVEAATQGAVNETVNT